MKKERIFSLVMVLLMLVAAAITVNKSIFGVRVGNREAERIEAQGNAKPELMSGEIVIHSSDVQGTINGYAGPVPLDIYVVDGKITEIKILPNAESPSFFKRACTVIDRWIGKTPREALDMKVDAVSGATYSSNAIINNVNVTLASYEGLTNRSSGVIPWKIWIAFAVTLAACIVPLLVKSKIYHNVQLIANVVVLGFWSGQFLDYALMLKYLSDGFTWPVGLVAVAMLIAAFIYPLFGHPQHYCSHVCPLGSAQQLVSQIYGHKIHISPKVLKILDWFRKILWAVLMLLLWTDCFTGWMDMELFQAFLYQSASWWIIGAAALFVALSAIISRPYCRFVCPTGSLFKRAENIG